MPLPGSSTVASLGELTGGAGSVLKLFSQNVVTGEERVVTEGVLKDYILTFVNTTPLSATQIRDLLAALTGANRLSADAIKDLPTGGGYATPEQVRDALVTLIGTARLPASAIKDLYIGAPTFLTITAKPEIVVIVEYVGTTAPTLTGDNANYIVTEKAGTTIKSIEVETTGPATDATASGNFILTAASENSRKLKAIVQIEDKDTGELKSPSDTRDRVLRSYPTSSSSKYIAETLGSYGSGFGIKFLF
jgi:hypothetical protein